MRHSRGEMYSGHCRLCVSVRLSLSLSLAAFPHYCTDPDVTWGNSRGCPLVVYYWADLQSVHGFCCYDNITPNAKRQRVLVLALGPMPGYISAQTPLLRNRRHIRIVKKIHLKHLRRFLGDTFRVLPTPCVRIFTGLPNFHLANDWIYSASLKL